MVAAEAGVANTLSIDCGSLPSGVSSRSTKDSSWIAEVVLRAEAGYGAKTVVSPKSKHGYCEWDRIQVQTPGDKHYLILLLSSFAQPSRATSHRRQLWQSLQICTKF